LEDVTWENGFGSNVEVTPGLTSVGFAEQATSVKIAVTSNEHLKRFFIRLLIILRKRWQRLLT